VHRLSTHCYHDLKLLDRDARCSLCVKLLRCETWSSEQLNRFLFDNEQLNRFLFDNEQLNRFLFDNEQLNRLIR
jgi:hypothetical protein